MTLKEALKEFQNESVLASSRDEDDKLQALLDAAVKEFEGILKNTGWIDVKEGLPEIPEGKKEAECFVGNAKTKGAQVGYFRGYYGNSPLFMNECDFSLSVTHWMPIPELPNTEA